MTIESAIVAEVDCSTGISTERQMTAEELADLNAKAVAAEVRKAEEAAAKEALDALKASAKSKLVAGTPLTEEEAATIVL
jgi:hypothetical protein